MAAKSMNILSELELIAMLESKKKLPPAFFFYGAEGIRIKKAVETIRSKVEKLAGDPSTAWSAYDLGEAGFIPFITDIKTVSFFGGVRGILASNFKPAGEGSAGSDEYPLQKEEQMQLLDYLSNPSPDVVLVIKTGKVDFRSGFWQELRGKTTAISFETTNESRRQIIGEMIKRSGLAFSYDSKRWMMERFVDAFQYLDSEMEKLITFMGEKKKVTVEDLENSMSAPKMEKIWALTEAVAGGEAEKALETIKSLKIQGEMPIKILPMIVRQFRLILICLSCKKKGLSLNETAKWCNLEKNPWLLEKYVKQTRNFTRLSLKKILYLLSRADVKIKSSSINEWLVFEEEILSLFSKKLIPSPERDREAKH